MSNAEIPTDNDGETDFVDDLMDMDGGKDALTIRLEAKRAEQEKKEKEKKKKNWLISRYYPVGGIVFVQTNSHHSILTAIAKDQKLLK
ncbi:hypothetical protein JH06_2510 [Blastocystis sp. subtype 4]|uniref:hypothetical protein n=1 Tax=Blastocystis sp. subtype 4 TaxID=944170 RepID=UPI000711A82B|nr:hypothetical protein JH06_2510 [Blastocystis sp. subtype 4]KNB44256.1 hypothetical protein JH06_2510 [Blastocystis sp. subtype 4]|eukprot:XP_014527699.1 hypothetical protein JH06_2510 [Blastocystis sp. subtype 4]